MKSPRWMAFFLLLGILLLLGFLFRSFLMDNVVRPLALVLWLVWRVLLSFDQTVIWSLLIFAGAIIVLLRLSQHGLTDIKPLPAPDHLTLENIQYWRTFILLSSDEKARVNILKQELIEILVALYTSRQPDTPHWEIIEALRQRQIPLPDNIHAFLFPPRPLKTRPSFRQALQTLRGLPARWSGRWSGRHLAGYYRSINEVLNFMESSLEINHDDK